MANKNFILEFSLGNWYRDPNTGEIIGCHGKSPAPNFMGNGYPGSLDDRVSEETTISSDKSPSSSDTPKHNKTPGAATPEPEVERRRTGLKAKLEREYFVPANPFHQPIKDLRPEHKKLYDGYLKDAISRMERDIFFPSANLQDYQNRFARLNQLNSGEDMMARAKNLGMDVFKALLYLKAAHDAYGGYSDWLPVGKEVLRQRFRDDLTDAKIQFERLLTQVQVYIGLAIERKMQNEFRPVYFGAPVTSTPLAAMQVR